jgi:hypothetical protein
MTCHVCGSENKPENRFCGSCGVAVRERQSAATACSACGNINEPNYKFCGKCGAKIERRDAAGGGEAAAITQENPRTSDLAASGPQADVTKPPEKPPVPAATRPVATAVSSTAPSRTAPADVPERDQDKSAFALPDPKRKAAPTTIGGPSFLGLSSDSENAEYLLEEDEGSSGSGRFRVLLAVLLLAGIAGAIFLQARARHNATPKSSELVKAVSADAAGPQAETPSAAGNAQNDASVPSPANNADTDQHPRQPEPKGDESKTANATAPSTDLPAKEPDTKKPDTKEDNQPVENAAIKKPVSKSDGGKEKLSQEPKPSMALVNAQRYLQGKGVRQNCAQGLQYLKTATEQKDPEATVQMAALYASGHCVRQDRVQAYKWFTSASELQPSNHWIEKNLNWLWADMTSAERRQISR